MKKILSLIVGCLIVLSLKAQSERHLGVELSYNHAELSIRQIVSSTRIWVNPYVGLANSDIDKNFNDVIFGLKVGYPLAKLGKSTFNIDAVVGGYIPNNKLYNAATLVWGLGIDYSLKISKNEKHLLIANLGFQHGERDYRQTFRNDLIYIETIDKFKVPTLIFSVGYAFKF